MKTTILLSVLTLLGVPQISFGKEWRGIVPLRSTRTDVERRFGKPNQFGYHELKQERVSFLYSDGPCRDLYLLLGKDNCKCLVDKDTVMSIFVEPAHKMNFSDLKLDPSTFTKTPISPYPSFSFYNPQEGVDYNVGTSGEITTVSYYPSAIDCENVIRARTPAHRNMWRSLIPLHSTRKDVDRVLGSPQRTFEDAGVYETDSELVSVKYAKGGCTAPSGQTKVAKDTVVELVVGLRVRFLLSRLNMDTSRYERLQQSFSAETPNDSIAVIYLDRASGISIRAESSGGPEEVVSITYFSALKDLGILCD